MQSVICFVMNECIYVNWCRMMSYQHFQARSSTYKKSQLLETCCSRNIFLWWQEQTFLTSLKAIYWLVYVLQHCIFNIPPKSLLSAIFILNRRNIPLRYTKQNDMMVLFVYRTRMLCWFEHYFDCLRVYKIKWYDIFRTNASRASSERWMLELIPSATLKASILELNRLSPVADVEEDNERQWRRPWRWQTDNNKDQQQSSSTCSSNVLLHAAIWSFAKNEHFDQWYFFQKFVFITRPESIQQTTRTNDS